jgi:formylglycine-generating enzyme required for sulfatase activity
MKRAKHRPVPDVIRIPEGEFVMGSDPSRDTRAKPEEMPQHSVYLSEYAIGRTPVTNSEYATFLTATKYRPPRHWRLLLWKLRIPPYGRTSHPVVNVSWHDARAYCEWLSRTTGDHYRLPTEAEWEKAARGTDARIYPWGDAWISGRCHISERTEATDTVPVGSYLAGSSPCGVEDMIGNVWEWTRSLWGRELRRATFTYPYEPNDGRENLDAASDVRRILRGASYLANIEAARGAARYRYSPRNFFPSVGFRVVKD